MRRQWEREGWKGWKAGQGGRYWAQGHEGYPWSKEGSEWMKGDCAAWERKQLPREERFYAQGHKGFPWQKEWMEWLEDDIIAQEKGADAAGEVNQPMVAQQAGEESDTEGMWAGEELHAKGRELELEGWRAWKAEGIERLWEGGYSGYWHGVADPGWLRVDYAAWKVHWAQKRGDREGQGGKHKAVEAA